VRRRDGVELVRAFRQGDVDARFALANTLSQKLKRGRSLARAGVAFEEIHAIAGKPAAEDVVETWNACGCGALEKGRLIGERHS